MARYRIVSMDGTSVDGPGGYVATGMLKQLYDMTRVRTEYRYLLRDVDLIAGNSVGGVNALFLAMYDDPDVGLQHAAAFWTDYFNVVARSMSSIKALVQLALALVGQASLMSTRPLRDYFEQHFGATTRLGDLKRRVLITSFQLDTPHSPRREWKPKIFNNFTRSTPDDKHELVVDVAMRTTAAPILAPIYQSLSSSGPTFVDGGVYANNPALCALSAWINELAHEHGSGAVDLNDILVMALSNGEVPYFVDPRTRKGFSSWGYARWVLWPCSPLRILSLMLDAGTESMDYMCRSMLRTNYRRLSPVLPGRMVATSGRAVEKQTQEILDLESTRLQLAAALAWVQSSGWLGGERDPQHAEAAPRLAREAPPET